MRSLVVLILVLAGCGDEHGPPIDADDTQVIRSCDDIDASGLTSATIDALVAMFDGRPCQAPLEGGIPGLLQECQYGQTLFVCGQSSGLSQFGCWCPGGLLSCSNGERIKQQQELLCDAGVD